MQFKEWLKKEGKITVYRGTGPEGVKEIRPSEEGVYGTGVYFYDNLKSAANFAEEGGGVIVGEVDENDVDIKEKVVYVVGTNIPSRKEKIIILKDPSKFKKMDVIPTEELKEQSGAIKLHRRYEDPEYQARKNVKDSGNPERAGAFPTYMKKKQKKKQKK